MKNVYIHIMLFLCITYGYSQNQCSLNGGFETALTTLPNPYTFSTGTGAFNIPQCGLPTVGFTPFTTAVPLNNFNSNITLVSPMVEPTLNSLGVTTVSTVFAGNRAIKLNVSPNPGGNDNGITNIATLSKVFTATNAAVDFRFSLIVKDGGHGPAQQPFFSARLYDMAGNLINTNQVCIQTNPLNCIFNVINTTPDPILYTDWQCARINIPNQFIGQNIRLEFVMADCGQTAHNGTVYIDDICTTNCSNPVFGSILLDPVNQHCPTSPFSVCGTYIAPPNSTYSSMTLNITQNGTTVAAINPTSLTGSAFCFTVNPSAFGVNPSGEYQVQVNATFNINCSPTPFPLLLFDDTNPVSFVNCCVPNLNITTTSPSPDQKEADISITATNTINNGITAIYHAGERVDLKPGFHSKAGSVFRGYIEECNAGFVGRPGVTSGKETVEIETESYAEVHNKEVVTLYPNPATDIVTITSEKSVINIMVASLDGKLMFNRDIAAASSYELDISNYTPGYYSVTITSSTGERITEKLIKN